MELALGLLGLFVGLLGLTWFSAPLYRTATRLRALWYAKRIAGRGNLSLERARGVADGRLLGHTSKAFFFCEWFQSTLVDADGGVTTSFRTLLVNISDEPKERINFQFNTSSKDENLHLWCKVKGTKYDLEPYSHDREKGVGEIMIKFPKPLQPREDLWVEYGYRLSNVYEIGDNWWGNYVGSQMGLLRVRIKFDDAWQISNLREELVGNGTLVRNANLRGKTIRWSIRAPVLAVRYRLRFDLGKKDADTTAQLSG